MIEEVTLYFRKNKIGLGLHFMKNQRPRYLAALFLTLAARWMTSPAFATEAEDYDSAMSSYDQGQYTQAVQGFARVIQENPNSWQAYQGMGSSLLQQGDRQGALQAYQKSLALHPDNPTIQAEVDKLSGLVTAATPSAANTTTQPTTGTTPAGGKPSPIQMLKTGSDTHGEGQSYFYQGSKLDTYQQFRDVTDLLHDPETDRLLQSSEKEDKAGIVAIVAGGALMASGIIYYIAAKGTNQVSTVSGPFGPLTEYSYTPADITPALLLAGAGAACGLVGGLLEGDAGQEKQEAVTRYDHLIGQDQNNTLPASSPGTPDGTTGTSPAATSGPRVPDSGPSITQGTANELNIGGQVWAWGMNVSGNYGGTEFYVPAFISINPAPDLSLYAQSEFGYSQTDALYFYPPTNNSFSGLSDTNLGAKWRATSGSAQPFVNLGVNLPTGQRSVRALQFLVPSEFVDARYQGVTFGLSLLAGVKFPDGEGEYRVEAGYMSPGVFNTTFDIPPGNTAYSEFEDTFLLSAGYAQNFKDGPNQAFGAWFLFHDAGNYGGLSNYEYGPNIDLYYQWRDPKAFSLEAGAADFLPSQITTGPSGGLTTEPDNSRGPRLYLNPSYTKGQVAFDAWINHVFANNYPQTDVNFDGGGWLLGIGPIWTITGADHTALKLSAAYNKIIVADGTFDSMGNRVDLQYDLFKLGADYEIDF